VRVLDVGLRKCLPEAGLAEALLATDRREPYVRRDIDTALEERGYKRVDIPASGPLGTKAGSDPGLPEELIEGDLKCLGDRSDVEETWLDRSLPLQPGQRSNSDAGFFGEPLPRPPTGLPQRTDPLGECSGVVVGTR
jgi:hypothetical protein